MTESELVTGEPDARAARRRLWLELLVVLLVAVVPDTINALASLVHVDYGRPPFWIDAVMLLQRSATVCAVVLMLMWLSPDRWREFGIVRWNWKIDPLIAVVLLPIAWYISGYVYVVAAFFFPPAAAADLEFPRPSGSELPLLLLMVAANSVAEEIAIWGFIFTRLAKLSSNAPLAILISAGCFAVYHLYKGPAAAVSILSIGLLHGVLFWRMRRLWPLVVSHTAWNLIVYAYAT